MAEVRSVRGWLSAALVSLVITGVAVSSAQAVTPEITTFTATPTTTQAGGHPDAAFDVEFTTPQDPRTISVHFPTGFIGNVHAAPRCTLAEFNLADCPVDSQIGVFELNVGGGTQTLLFPGYSMETNPNQSGLLALTVPIINTPVFQELSGRTDSDYGFDVTSTPQTRVVIVNNINGHIWGVPADPVHDFQRFVTPLAASGACYAPKEGCLPGLESQSPTFAKPTIPPVPFLQNPTTCGVPLVAKVDVEFYGGGVIHDQVPWPAGTGCKQLSFNPSLTVKPTTAQADTASGADVDIRAPQAESPTTPSPSELRTNRVILPEGFSINPSAVDGKVACPDAATGFGTLLGATCPDFSKVGTLTLDVASLPAPIPGAIYLGEPKPGERYRLILAADGFAVHVKLIGSVRPDPRTGQLTISFEELPQQPLQDINAHFFGSERGLLATPAHCGTYVVEGEFVPWDAELTTRQTIGYMTVDQGPNGTPCPIGPRPFAPKVGAGAANNTAGTHSPLTLNVNREDGEQSLAGLTVATPPGFTATLKGVPYCPDAAIARLSGGGYAGLTGQAPPPCPAASQIGTATAGAGAGTHPLYVGGKVYLAGPYKGAPLSLVAVIPAVSGPYDLGNVVVRAALHVDETTAQVTAVADPLPQIIEGIPLRTRYIQVDLDRPGFALNPTNCDPSAVSFTLTGDEGAVAAPSTPFQVANCAELPYAPKLGLKLTGGLNRLGHPAIHAEFKAGSGEANTRSVKVSLPAGELLDNSHIGTVCTRVRFATQACPAGSLIGQAEVTTPLLDQPLRGPVYLRSSSQDLPDVAIALRGQVDITLVGHVDSAHAGLRVTFKSVPDVPVTRFVVDLAGGHRGLLQNSESLCLKPKKAKVAMAGQNGADVAAKAKLQVSCGKARHKRRSSRNTGSSR